MDTYQDRIIRLTKEAIEELYAIGIHPGKIMLPPLVNSRAKRRLGCCRAEIQKGERIYYIEISSSLAEKDDRAVKEVILHELLHTCPDCLNHGKTWKSLAQRVNRVYGFNITATARAEDCGPPAYRYMIVCRKCGRKIYRMRKSRVVTEPKAYRCSCGGRLEAFTIKRQEKLE